MLNLLFPAVCNGCSEQLQSFENVLCTECRQNIPLSCFHRSGDESMKNIFYGRIPVQAATSLFRFQKKGITQQLLHNLKYRGQKQISDFLGKWLGSELSEIAEYKKIDLVIPVPLQKNKLRRRGYNQVSGFGREIAAALGVPFREDVLIKASKTHSQVFKTRLSRYGSEKIFQITSTEALENRHILLVDDIVTTGATLENCANQILAAKDCRLSLATMAVA